MFSLRLLGGLSLEEEGAGPVSGPAGQPVRLALLVVLTVPESRRVSRDRIAALLWPESSTRRGRRNLSDTLYVLRRELGEEAIRSSGDALRVDPDRVRTDVAEFRRALERGEPGEAVRVYGGPFLDGVHLRDSVEFERWVDARRDELARAHHEALASLAGAAASAGDAEAEVRWRRKLAAERPYSTAAAVRLMRALERAGEPGAAVRTAHLHRERLREELGAEPDPTLEEELERIRTSPESAEFPPAAQGTTSGPTGPPPVPAPLAWRGGGAPLGRGRVSVLVAALLFVAAGTAAWLLEPGEEGGTPGRPDPDRVAVFPFRVSGASPSLAYLREGMVDLLAAKLTGEVGPRAVDSRTSLAVWRQAVGGDGRVGAGRIRRMAARAGAGRALLGEVVGTPERLTVVASLEPVEPGNRGITAQVEGAADSLAVLVDRLVGRLLVETTGDPGPSLAALTSRSLPALRDYLAGRRAYRAGERRRAVDRFNEALDRDSAFALAAIGLAEAGFTLPGGSAGRNRHVQRGLQLALAARGRLAAPDRRYLEALARPRYPARMFPWSEVIERWEEVVGDLDQKPEAWYQLGLHLTYFGPQTGRTDVHALAVRALGRALRLDSTYRPALERLIWLEAREGDREAVERLARRYGDRDPTAGASGFTRWRIALALDDRESLAELRGRIEEMSNGSLGLLVGLGQVDGVGLEDVRRAAGELRERLRDREPFPGAHDRGAAIYLLKSYAINGGRPRRADSLLRIRWEGRLDWPRYHRDRIYAALYEGGDTAGIAASVRRLEEGRVDPMPTGHALSDTTGGGGASAYDRCLAWQWRLRRGDTAGAATAIRRVRAEEPVRDEPCATVLELLLAAARGGEAARRHRPVAEEYVAEGWHWPLGFMLNFAAARLHERLGDYGAAAEALRHRPYRPATGTWTLGRALREEARLWLLAGDTARSLAAHRHWLALHDDPEASREDEVTRVRRLVAKLEGRRGAVTERDGVEDE